jgi:hypothetical protein
MARMRAERGHFEVVDTEVRPILVAVMYDRFSVQRGAEEMLGDKAMDVDDLATTSPMPDLQRWIVVQREDGFRQRVTHLHQHRPPGGLKIPDLESPIDHAAKYRGARVKMI